MTTLTSDVACRGFGQIASVQVPDANPMGVYAPRTVNVVDEQKDSIRLFATRSQPKHLWQP